MPPEGKDTSVLPKSFGATLDAIVAEQPKGKDPTKELSGNPVSVGAPVIEADAWASKQLRRAAAAGADWKEGVLHPRRNPVDAAIKAAGKWADRLQSAIRDKKFEAGLKQVDVDAMYATIEKLGEAVFVQGIEAREAKVRAKIAKLRPLVLALKQTIDAMPDATDADRVKRLLAAREGMLLIGKKMRGLA